MRTEQLQHLLESVNRELDQRHEDIRAHRLLLNTLQEKCAANTVMDRIVLVVLGLLQAGNIALIGYLFRRLEEINQIVNRLL